MCGRTRSQLRALVQRLDGVTLHDPVREPVIQPGMNRHLELDLADSDQAVRLQQRESAERKLQVLRNTGQLPEGKTQASRATTADMLRAIDEAAREAAKLRTPQRGEQHQKSLADRAKGRDPHFRPGGPPCPNGSTSGSSSDTD